MDDCCYRHRTLEVEGYTYRHRIFEVVHRGVVDVKKLCQIGIEDIVYSLRTNHSKGREKLDLAFFREVESCM